MSLDAAEAALRATALGYPEADEHFPWGERVIKVRGKIFLYLTQYQRELRIGVKLPASRDFALVFPFAEPMGYGLGKSGWIGLRFASDDGIDLPLFERWIDESYRAIAPKKLSALLPA